MRPIVAAALTLALALSACGGSPKKKYAVKERHVPACHPPLREQLRGKIASLTNLECAIGQGQNDFCGLALYPPDTIACFADLIDDRTPLPADTKLPMVPGNYTVGDAAVFLSVHMLEIPLQDVLPPEQELRFGAEGMAVYFEAMSTDDGREAVRQGVMTAAARSRR